MDYTTDCIHDIMQLPDYVYEIIATEEFSRLKNLKQLGVTNYIFQEAVHTRYDHSIGVSHLCQTILKTLETNSEIQIDYLHKKCVIVSINAIAILKKVTFIIFFYCRLLDYFMI